MRLKRGSHPPVLKFVDFRGTPKRVARVGEAHVDMHLDSQQLFGLYDGLGNGRDDFCDRVHCRASATMWLQNLWPAKAGLAKFASICLMR